MIAAWAYTLNKKPTKGGNELMTLESILSSINVTEPNFELNPKYKTIRYMSEEEYTSDVYKYVEPNFTEAPIIPQCSNERYPRFLIFSAPGATGKTALAKYICYKKHGIYWDLPDNKVAEFSFQGAISQAVSFEKFGEFVQSVQSGENFFVIDAFDEAEAGSGRTGIEFFLRDLNAITNSSNCICAILLARTESAIFIKNYFVNNDIPFRHYEVGHFAEYNAKSYINNIFEKKGVRVTDIIKKCIDEQFLEIHRIFSNEDAEAFLGYAPVLDALAASYDDERNTLILLKETANGEKNCDLIKKILDRLLLREQDKFLRALKIKAAKVTELISAQNLYNTREQLYRIFGMLLLNDSNMFVDVKDLVPVEYCDEYLETVNTQLPQHPFVNPKESNNETVYEFTGAAFYDFVMAFCLADNDLCDFVNDYFSEHGKYCPSQMLIEFYEIFSKGHIRGRHIPLMYSSFKAHAKLGDRTLLRIHGEKNDCYVEFELVRDNKSILFLEFELVDLDDGVFIEQLSNCYIDIVGKVIIGNASGEARIDNSIIRCDEIYWNSEQISIEAYSPGECVIFTDKIRCMTSILPRFEVKTDDKKNFKISASNLGNYFKLVPYKCESVFDSGMNDFNSFANVVRRILSCLRSHSKDTPARKMDFIDNRIISVSEYKKKILLFLLDKKLLYTDDQDWLYKLDTGLLEQYSIKWHDVREGNLDSLLTLYNMYLEY